MIALAVVPARQRPQTTYVPHAWPGVGNGGGRRVRQGSTSPAPIPLDSTPTLFFIAAILLWENDDVGIVLFYSVIYNSVVAILYEGRTVQGGGIEARVLVPKVVPSLLVWLSFLMPFTQPPPLTFHSCLVFSCDGVLLFWPEATFWCVRTRPYSLRFQLSV